MTYSKIEKFNEPSEIDHPAVREALRDLNMTDLNINYDADLPARSGLGTSSAFAVGLLNGLHVMRGELVDKMTLAKEAIELERVKCREAGGVQDQLACAFGGLNKMVFTSKGYEVIPLPMLRERKEQFCNQLLLFFTGFTRKSSTLLERQIANTKNKLRELDEMASLVDDGVKVLLRNNDTDNFKEFGLLLDHTWKIKRSLTSGISNDGLDAIYEKAKNAGAIGGKILGGGGGGFFLFMVEPDARKNVIEALGDLPHVPFKLEDEGSKVIYFQSESRLKEAQ